MATVTKTAMTKAMMIAKMKVREKVRMTALMTARAKVRTTAKSTTHTATATATDTDTTVAMVAMVATADTVVSSATAMIMKKRTISIIYQKYQAALLSSPKKRKTTRLATMVSDQKKN